METAPTTLDFTPEEALRYSRHMIMPEVGPEGQMRLKAAKVLLVGAGGLGSPAALYLAAAGVGTIGIVDFDNVDPSNLHRQVLHGTKDIGRSKLDSAIETLSDINPHVHFIRHEARFSSANAMEIAAGYDMIVDGTDNFPTRYLVNDVCVLLGIPNVYGSIFRFDGQATIFAAKGGPCYRCLYPEPPPPGTVPNCAEGGVLGILPGLVGVIQATEAVKLILGIGEPLIGRLMMIDALTMQFREIKIRRDPECPICGGHPTVKELIDYESFCGVSNAVKPSAGLEEIEPTEIRAKLDRGEAVTVVDVREPFEHRICSVPEALLIPMDDVAGRLGELDPQREIAVICHTGMRSAHIGRMLLEAGFSNVKNVRGGIERWAVTVDPTMARY